MRKAFFEEFGGRTRLRKLLDNRYRFHKISLQTVLEGGSMKNHSQLFVLAEELFTEKEKKLRMAYTDFSETAIAQGKLERPVNFIDSYMHMFINRLFTSEQRKYELLTYHFLAKYFLSLQARKKHITVS